MTTEELYALIDPLLKSDRRLQAVKIIRREMGWDLISAKELTDVRKKELGIKDPPEPKDLFAPIAAILKRYKQAKDGGDGGHRGQVKGEETLYAVDVPVEELQALEDAYMPLKDANP